MNFWRRPPEGRRHSESNCDEMVFEEGGWSGVGRVSCEHKGVIIGAGSRRIEPQRDVRTGEALAIFYTMHFASEASFGAIVQDIKVLGRSLSLAILTMYVEKNMVVHGLGQHVRNGSCECV
ncbi:hypothetical protein CFOL_v3_09526 [Cephalotus follicularis]|uniref:Uncharacterized protein n=1 Tax=Cephalotus follicularis TaxID=3775 RepID=A0A1Q3BDM5_CEPFO|nr:hypothetical protein CFOL_v3_09526 [Cephalotus follicularis]